MCGLASLLAVTSPRENAISVGTMLMSYLSQYSLSSSLMSTSPKSPPEDEARSSKEGLNALQKGHHLAKKSLSCECALPHRRAV